MNGRAYDYNLGRFLSVDPFIQFPENSQSLNPYSYIMNNPLSGTDPTGYKSCSGDLDDCDLPGAGESVRVQTDDGVITVSADRDGNIAVASGGGFDAISDINSAFNQNRGNGLTAQFGSNHDQLLAQNDQTTQRCEVLGPAVCRSDQAIKQVGEIASDTADVIDTMVTPEPSDMLFLGAGAAINKLLKGRKAMNEARDGAQDIRRADGGVDVARERINIPDEQFSKKLGRHFEEFGLDPTSASDRAKFRSIIEEFSNSSDRIIEGSFRGQDSVKFFIKGQDVVVTNASNDFVTILNNGITNPSVQRAIKDKSRN